MKPYQFFSLQRFLLVCRKEVTEQWKTLLLRFIMTYGILAVVLTWYGLVMYNINDLITDTQGDHTIINIQRVQHGMIQIFIFGFGFLSCISASCIMEPMKTKAGRISFLMYPASMFEKYLSRWLIYTIGFSVAFLIAYWLADCTKVLVCSLTNPDLRPIVRTLSVADWKSFDMSGMEWLKNVSILCFLQSLFVLGSSIWPKHALVKTMATLVIFGIANMLLTMGVVYNTSLDGPIRHNLPDSDWISIIICSAIALFCWTIAYFRFKESEIINRW